MKKYNFLVLTEHTKHSSQNSLYVLIAALVGHEQTNQVYVASRGNAENKPFFEDRTSSTVEATLAKASFAYQADGIQFLEATQTVDIQSVDVVLMRLPRPATDAFLEYLVAIAPKQIFVNDPKGIIKTSTKEFLLNFPSVCPPMTLCHSVVDVFNFAAKYPIVLKPLREYGGKGVVKVVNHTVFAGDEAPKPLKEYLAEIKEELETDGYLAMKFLKNVSEGDKRILVVNGEILASSLRLPAPDSWLCNIAQGGTAVASTVSPEEEQIIQKIAPVLLKEGIVMFGADTLVNDDGKRILSEVNTLSIGGFPQAQAQTGKPIVKMAIDHIIAYVNEKVGQ
ncbi:MAG: Glutathione synthetase (EC [uncultured Aureispira sp.]|uniref:Glutathione synthetase (EC) n=1 Tax=uncultured Aureispira sp. TaxID=1331704 RepID=A0A6S6UJ44_9BACT|nr:MAG: Glutathione synthetase (EC [uncultured Aureispira sp.]